MKHDSYVAKVLAHFAWLEADLQEHGDQRRQDALRSALLTYNAAVMLQWRIVCPLSSADMIQNPREQQAVTVLVRELLDSSRKAVTDLEAAVSKNVAGSLKALRKGIRKALAGLPPLFRLAEPKAARLTQLERNPDIPQLIREYMAEHERELEATRTTTAAVLASEGPDAAIREAIAQLIVSTADNGNTMVLSDPEARRASIRMAKGLLKTAVDLKSEDHDSPELRPLKDLADAMLVDTAGTF
jgi:hypothetical protein